MDFDILLKEDKKGVCENAEPRGGRIADSLKKT